MITLLAFIWFVGWLFTFGTIAEEAEGSVEKLILTLFFWPVALGILLRKTIDKGRG